MATALTVAEESKPEKNRLESNPCQRVIVSAALNCIFAPDPVISYNKQGTDQAPEAICISTHYNQEDIY